MSSEGGLEKSPIWKFAIPAFRGMIYLLNIILFVIATSNIWAKYNEGYTFTNIRLRNDGVKSKKLPFISLCPKSPFKKRGDCLRKAFLYC